MVHLGFAELCLFVFALFALLSRTHYYMDPISMPCFSGISILACTIKTAYFVTIKITVDTLPDY